MSTGDSPVLRLVCEGSGPINIPMDRYIWPEKPTKHKKWELSQSHIRYIRRYQHQPWIDRAYSESFWQCRMCGWKPWPVPVIFCGEQVTRDGEPQWDDSVWAWFSGELDTRERQMLVRDSKTIRRFEREIETSPRTAREGYSMREAVPNCR